MTEALIWFGLTLGQILIVTKLDRLSRSLKDIAELIDRYFDQTYSLGFRFKM